MFSLAGVGLIACGNLALLENAARPHTLASVAIAFVSDCRYVPPHPWRLCSVSTTLSTPNRCRARCRAWADSIAGKMIPMLEWLQMQLRASPDEVSPRRCVQCATAKAHSRDPALILYFGHSGKTARARRCFGVCFFFCR